jgi:uncharacterized protein (TIGR00251 family)
MPDRDPPWVEPTSTGINISVYVAPRAAANKVVGLHSGAIKISLTAPPVDGAANKALLEFLAGALGMPRSSLSLVSGHTSRNKLVRVLGVSVEAAMRKLAPGD